MYLKIIKKNFKAHPLINILIILQMIAVFTVSLIMTSAVDEKVGDYIAIKDLLENDGLFCNGWFQNFEDNGEVITGTDQIKEKLRNVELVSTINYTNLETGYTVTVETPDFGIPELGTQSTYSLMAYALIYDDYAANLYIPEVQEGVWITESNPESEYPQAVITENPYGYKVGDIAKFQVLDVPIEVEIIGIIGDNEKYLGTISNNSIDTIDIRTPSYLNLFGRHFNSVRDEYTNLGYTEEQIERSFESDGYTEGEEPVNQPVVFFSMDEWNKTGAEAIMSDLLYIKYNESITEEEKMYNRKFVNEDMPLLSYSLRFSEIQENSLNMIMNDVYTLLPIIAAIYILAMIGSISVNAINCKNQSKSYSILYLCGAKKKHLILISMLYNIIVCLTALIITLGGFLICKSANLLENTVIQAGVYQLLLAVIIILVFVCISCIVPYVMLSKKSLNESLRKSGE